MEWYVLKTKSNQEFISEKHLNDTQVENFLPRQVCYKRHAGDMRESRRLLFPGYIFVKPSPRQIQTMGYVRGSCGLVGFNKKPAPVPEQEIVGIRSIAESPYPVSVQQGFQVGSKVKLLIGDFQEVEGHLVRVTSGYRLVINILALHKSISIELDARDAEPSPSGLRIRVPGT